MYPVHAPCRSLVPAVVALCCASALPGQQVFDITRVDDGVYAGVVRDDAPYYAFANSLVVVTEAGVLVVDTQQSPSAARALIAAIRRLTDQPVRWVVNTHWHGDHVYGNGAYRRAFPDVHFIAHEATAILMRTEGRARLRQEVEELPATIEDRRGWLETGTGPGGEPLTAEQRAAVRRSLRARRRYLAELERLELIPPDIVVSSDTTLHLGGREIRLLAMGPAHTPGDLALHLPDSDLLAAGDLLEEAAPWLEGAMVTGWAAALRRLAALEPRYVLPSHGTLDAGPALLDWQSAFFGAAVRAARAGLERGLDRAATIDRADLTKFRDAFRSVGVADGAFRDYVVAAVGGAYDELSQGDGAGRDGVSDS